MNKICTKCKVSKNVEYFYYTIHSTAKDRRNAWCKDCFRVVVRNSYLKRLYGIDAVQYQEMLDAQDGGCAICGKIQDSVLKRTGENKRLAVDHDKNTGLVRGILCENCNRGIGMFNHNIDLLESAITYLRDFEF